MISQDIVVARQQLIRTSESGLGGRAAAPPPLFGLQAVLISVSTGDGAGTGRMNRMYRSCETIHGIAMARHGGNVSTDGGMHRTISAVIER